MIVNIHFDYDKFKSTHETLELLCDLELILGLPCFMPMLKVVQTFIKNVQYQDFLLLILWMWWIFLKLNYFTSILIPFQVLMIQCLMTSPNYYNSPMMSYLCFGILIMLGCNGSMMCLPLFWCSCHVELEYMGFKIARQNYVVHIHSLVDKSWIKVDEIAFRQFAITMKKSSCVEAIQTLIFELQRQFLDHEIMMALGFVYSQYRLNLAIIKGSFFLHLSVIKSTFGVVHRIAKGIMFLPFLDSHMLDVQSSFYKLIMTHNARK